jgi:tetratricopeptide (TPR) repeat protein
LMSMPGIGLAFETAHSIMRPAAAKALELDPLLAEAHAAMGWVYSREFDWASAQESFQRAIDLNPGLTETYTSYSIATLRPLGKSDDAVRLLTMAAENDPLSLDVQREIGEAQIDAGRYAEAIDTFQRVRTVDPNFPLVGSQLARALMFAGRPAEALPLLEQLDGRNLGRFGGPSTIPVRLAFAYVLVGRRAEAEKLAAMVTDHTPSSQVLVYAALGDKDRTFEALEQMAVVQPHRVALMLNYPEMALLRGDPRLAPLRGRFNLP